MYGLGGSLGHPDLLADNPNPKNTSDPAAPTIHLTRTCSTNTVNFIELVGPPENTDSRHSTQVTLRYIAAARA